MNRLHSNEFDRLIISPFDVRTSCDFFVNSNLYLNVLFAIIVFTV